MNFSISKKNFSSNLLGSSVFIFNGIKIYYKESNQNKIGFIVSRAFGSAVKRNLFKRRCRYFFINKNSNYSKKLSVIVRPIDSNHFSFDVIENSFNKLFKKL